MKFEGIIPALVTPLTEDEHINTPVLVRLVEHLLELGADGFYAGGATGEGLALRTKERFVLAESIVNAVAGRVPTIIQIAAMDFSDAVALAKHAERIGADAISATPPLFFQYDETDIYNYYKELADSVHIPMMIYYNPAAGFRFHAELAARLFEVDNITAIKWTSSDYYEMMRLKHLTNGEMNIINGPDEMLLQGLSAGADGGIGTTYNFMLEKYLNIYRYFKAGDLDRATAEQTAADAVIAALKPYKIIPAAKVLLEALGFAVGNAAFPMKRYTESEKKALLAAVQNAGLPL